MKKLMCIMLAAFLIFTLQLSAAAAPAKKVPAAYTPASINIVYDGKPLQLKHKPMRYKEFILVPAQEFYEYLGANVTWDKDAEMLAVNTNTDSILFFKDQQSVIINAIQYPMVTPAVMVNGTLMIEVTSAASSLNYGVYAEGNDIYMEPVGIEEDTESKGDIYDWNIPTDDDIEKERIKHAYKYGI